MPTLLSENFDEAAAQAFDDMARRELDPYERFKWMTLADEARARAAAARWPVIEFTWTGPRHFEVDGELLPSPGRGLVLAWLTLASRQLGVTPPPLTAVFKTRRPDACAVQALVRSASAVRPYSAALAHAIEAMGTQGDRIVLKRAVGVDIRCASPMLERMTTA